jgi:cephalosporin hydroxylase
MSLVTALPRNAWRRLARIGPLTEPMSKLKDRVETLRFHVDGRHRADMERLYANCKTLKDYYDVSTTIFGPHQLEKEILSFLEFAAADRPRAVCEIGTANGGTTFLLGQALPTTEVMIGIDLFVKRRPRLEGLARPGQKIVLVSGDSGTPDTLDRLRAALAGRELDVLFIDGDHTLEGVTRDFQLYRPFVRDGGIIAFHDIMEDSFTRTGVKTGHWTGGVPQFWKVLKPQYDSREFVQSYDQDGLGIGVIRYDRSVDPIGLVSVT